MELKQYVQWLLAEYKTTDNLQYKLETADKLKACGVKLRD